MFCQDGEPLLVLPEKHVETETLEFSPEEREVCQLVRYPNVRWSTDCLF